MCGYMWSDNRQSDKESVYENGGMDDDGVCGGREQRLVCKIFAPSVKCPPLTLVRYRCLYSPYLHSEALLQLLSSSLCTPISYGSLLWTMSTQVPQSAGFHQAPWHISLPSKPRVQPTTICYQPHMTGMS